MEIKIKEILPGEKKPKPKDESKLGFGKIFSDHFFTMEYKEGVGWRNASIEPYRPLILDPAAMCLHYGQEFFEGMKAYRGKDGAIYLFRPMENIRRMNSSAERLCSPVIDEELFLEALKKLIILDKDWIPKSEGTALYIRPTMIATEAALGVHPADEFLFFIILCPVGAYYPQGFSPTKIYVSEEHVRAVRGGVGNIKAAGNYAASLLASKKASALGCTQVLWLDALERKYVEEVGTSNIFILIGDELLTPPLSGSILPGVTRDSVIAMARSWGVKVTERAPSIDEIIMAHGKGTLKEIFASGTAAIVSPVGQICYKDIECVIGGGKVGKLTERLYREILDIQYGVKNDPFGWRVKIYP
ncbi:MAG: branched-chain amino acid aminotransferase [Deltaproteobacteria bacterium]|nr:branched-chain amino acid aminotransferase [Deltaproteobacteria bacterium]